MSDPLHADCEAILLRCCQDLADQHDHLQKLAQRYFPEAEVYGDSYGVPGVEDLADMIAAKLDECLKPRPWWKFWR